MLGEKLGIRGDKREAFLKFLYKIGKSNLVGSLKTFLELKSYVFEKSVSVCQFKSKKNQTNKLDTVTGIIKS